MEMDTLEEWLEVQGRFLNMFDKKYGFKRMEKFPNGDISLVFDGVDYTATKHVFELVNMDELEAFADLVEFCIRRFWD